MNPMNPPAAPNALSIQKQQSVPLTPNLKHSDPFQRSMIDDKSSHMLKRSNSQAEFDLLTSDFLDIGDPQPFRNLNNEYTEMLAGAPDHPQYGAAPERSFPSGVVGLFASALSATGLPPPAQQSLGGAGGEGQGAGGRYNMRNSFDFMEMDSGQNLLEMTPNSYSRMVRESHQFSHP